MHLPVAVRFDVVGPKGPEDFLTLAEVPLEETWAGMTAALELGLTRHIGVSNYNLERLRAHAGLASPPEVIQVELHPYLQQQALVDGEIGDLSHRDAKSAADGFGHRSVRYIMKQLMGHAITPSVSGMRSGGTPAFSATVAAPLAAPPASMKNNPIMANRVSVASRPSM